MDRTQYENLKRMAKFLKEQPGYMQKFNLLMLCKAGFSKNRSTFESIARILAEYGVSVDDVFPCIVDIMMALAEEEAEKGQHST